MMMQKNHLQRERNGWDPRQELRSYLESPLEDVTDLMKWWGVS